MTCPTCQVPFRTQHCKCALNDMKRHLDREKAKKELISLIRQIVQEELRNSGVVK